jgi:choline dehydrogenase
MIPDYIIVGGGTSGCVIAGILSSEFNVLIIESGDDLSHEENVRDSSKALSNLSNLFPYYWWQGQSVGSKQYQYTGGRLLGGSSSVNGLQYIRGRNIENIYPDAISQFKEFEKYSGDSEELGRKGYLPVRQAPKNPSIVSIKFCSAIERATGIPRVNDYNDPHSLLGPFTQWDYTQYSNGMRASSDLVFLNDRVEIFFNSTVTKIIFRNDIAIGVEYLELGVSNKIFCNEEVIISAGIKSSKLLMLSGIGDSEMLDSLGIETIVDNPRVGKNLRNHLICPVVFNVPEDENRTEDKDAIFSIGAFLPEIGGKERVYEILGISNGTNLTFAIMQVNGKSTGEVKLLNADPLSTEIVDFKYFSDSNDLETFKRFFRDYFVKIVEEIKKIDSTYKLISPSLEEINDDQKLENYIMKSIFQADHFTGTCSIGTVVNESGRVFGVENLRVIDASIMPINNDGNTQAIAYFFGWKLGKEILNE